MSDIKEATQDFNPRLREGGDSHIGTVICFKRISIHASEKEATCTQFAHTYRLEISIHASEKEATMMPM